MFLTLNPDSPGIALHATRFDFDCVGAGREIIGQTENYLCEAQVRHGSDIFRPQFVTLIITPNQINDDRGREFALRQLEIGDKEDDPSVFVRRLIKQVGRVDYWKRVSGEEC